MNRQPHVPGITSRSPGGTAEATGRRRVVASAIEARRARDIVKPHAARFAEWNSRAAHLRARAASAYLSATERAAARMDADALLDEVMGGHAEFRQAVDDEPPNGWIADVEAAYRRLISQLSAGDA